MSVDLLIFPTAGRFVGREITAAFGEFASPTDYGLRLDYDDENNAFIYFELDESGTTNNFCVNRPCDDRRLYEALFAFMASHNAWLVSSDGEPVVRVASHEGLQAARAAIRDPQVQITVVNSPDALLG